jgi:hypothetical protein
LTLPEGSDAAGPYRATMYFDCEEAR